MKNYLLKSVLLSVVVFIGINIHQAKAEVRVFQANPSAVGSGGPFYLDIDNNGVNDYTITVTGSTVESIQINGLNANNMIETDGSGKAIALNQGAPVGNNSFQNTAKIYESQGTGFYYQIGAVKYLGLRFQVSGITHYGYFE